MDLRPHDLLRLDPGALDPPADLPAWAARELARGAPWVVVRRAAAEPGTVAAGLRGFFRNERRALSVPRSCVRERVTPEALVLERRWGSVRVARRGLPAFEALEEAAGRLGKRGLAWGPGGSVGYELASGLPAVTGGSDLDLILRCPEPLPREIARRILQDLSSLPARADAQIDTGIGSVALSEWAAGGEVLLRRTEGPTLTTDPWAQPEPSRPAAGAFPGAYGR